VTPRFVTLVVDIDSSSTATGGLRGLVALKASSYSNKFFKKEVSQKHHENIYQYIASK
jgi:hypothetical protein